MCYMMYTVLSYSSIPNTAYSIEYITNIYSTSSTIFLCHGLYNCLITLVPNTASDAEIFNKTLSIDY